MRLAVFILLLAVPAYAQESAVHLRNGDFELPPMSGRDAWRPIPADLEVRADPHEPYAGQASFRITRDRSPPGSFVALAQALDATPFRGYTVRFRAAVRANVLPGGAGAGLWLRVDRPGGATGFFDNMSDRAIRSADWAVYEIVGPVAEDATRLTVGLLLSGVGTAWIDAASLEVLAELPADAGDGAAPTREGLRNLTAFTKLYGYVRWFSPYSDPADSRWSVIAAQGALEAEAAESDSQLITVLERWFRPMAPGLVVSGQPAIPTEPAPTGANLVRWRHTGVEFSAPVYESERIAADHSAGWTAELVDDIHIWMPLTAPSGAVNLTRDAPLPAAQAPDSRASRLGAVVISWNVFRHFYPGFKDDGVDWDSGLQARLASAATAVDANGFRNVLRRMVADLHDGHGAVSPRPEGYRLPLVWQPVEGEIVVTGLPGDAPPGVAVGDIVLTVDGVPAGSELAARSAYISASTTAYRRWRAAEEMLWRADPQSVHLRLRSRDGAEREVEVMPSPATNWREIAGEPRPAPITWFPAGAWYFDLTRLDHRALSVGLERVQPHEPVVFDLRGYPRDIRAAFLGRLAERPIETPPFRIPVHLLPDGRDRTWKPVGWSVAPQAPRLQGPVAFLTDARAISYSETLLAMVRGHALAEIVGEPTAGTNGNSNTFTVPGGHSIVWTGMEVLNHDGSELSGHGVQPTIPASRTIAGVAGGRDEVLERGLEFVTSGSTARERLSGYARPEGEDP
ncbi:hypothetical protein IWC96_00480 [Brevundimonas sp. BAL450]|uniref:S41 family peptidase n=1 Tax=Brevundimonas sp. BAL450 TaxID=1708162 RepID=UPI0018C8F713|nr:S41 family peptidase [Brevundimonas sp. BAL450]MBG7613754.1 hypothetical protein [Brevundimonas sp. BAL450]